MSPSYSYFCEQCGKEEEVFMQRIVTDADDEKHVCCGEKMVRPIYSPTCLKFVGKGQYIQDIGFNNDSDKNNFYKKKLKEKLDKKNGIK